MKKNRARRRAEISTETKARLEKNKTALAEESRNELACLVMGTIFLVY